MNNMHLIHALAEIKEQELVYQTSLWFPSKIAKPMQNGLKHAGKAPSLKDNCFLFAKFGIGCSNTGNVGLHWGRQVVNENMLENRFSISVETGIWKIQQTEIGRGIIFFEKRGRILLENGEDLSMVFMQIQGHIYFYIQNMDIPIFHCPASELICGGGGPYLYMDYHEFPCQVDMRIWNLHSVYMGALSVSALLQAWA